MASQNELTIDVARRALERAWIATNNRSVKALLREAIIRLEMAIDELSQESCHATHSVGTEVFLCAGEHFIPGMHSAVTGHGTIVNWHDE